MSDFSKIGETVELVMHNGNKCKRCERVIVGDYYVAPANKGCVHLLCFLLSVQLVRRSTFASIFVGTILLFLNQGDFILAGNFYKAMAWKIPLTYLVPFLVATWSAVTNSRVRLGI